MNVSAYSSQQIQQQAFITKAEPQIPQQTSTPIQTKSTTSKLNQHHNNTGSKLIASTQNMNNLLNMHSGSTAGQSASANNNSNGSAGQLLTNTPLTLVATSNGIGGITLTALGSLHQHVFRYFEGCTNK